MKLPDNLKRIRKENNLSQEQLAEKLGVSRQAVSKWESGQSYPEMDKVLTICKLFNYNIDELMNENVKEVSQNKESKINFNKYVDDFFEFITKTITMFEHMKFGQKVKCIFEQIIIIICLVCVFAIISSIGGSIVSDLFGWLSRDIYYFVIRVLSSLYLLFSCFVAVVIVLHIFKIRYLDYFEIVKGNEKEENNNVEESKIVENSENKIKFSQNKKEKIIIRDPEHSESKLLNAIAKMIILGVKAFTCLIACFFIFTLIMILTFFVISFMFVKTGMVFFGALLCIVGAAVINIVILEILYDFIISKKLAKSRIGISFLASLVAIGIGCGFIVTGITKFDIVDGIAEDDLIKDVYTYQMEDNLKIYSHVTGNIEYIESNNTDVRIEIEHYGNCQADVQEARNNVLYVQYTTSSSNALKELRESIKDINNKQFKDYSYFKVKVYSTKENIKKLKENLYLDEQNDEVDRLEHRIEKLNDIIEEKDEEINRLENIIQDREYDEEI